MTKQEEKKFIKKCFGTLVEKRIISKKDIKKSTVTKKMISKLESSYKMKLPSLYKTYLMSYRYSFTELYGTVWNYYRKKYEYQWVDIVPVLKKKPLSNLKYRLKNELDEIKENGYFTFGDWGKGWGSLCFDTKKNLGKVKLECPNTWSIVWFDHEDMNIEDIKGSALPACPDFKTFLEWYFLGIHETECEE